VRDEFLQFHASIEVIRLKRRVCDYTFAIATIVEKYLQGIGVQGFFGQADQVVSGNLRRAIGALNTISH
jgi:hypothetical protein